jgi:eukaryotic translation initiation factor 2C
MLKFSTHWPTEHRSLITDQSGAFLKLDDCRLISEKKVGKNMSGKFRIGIKPEMIAVLGRMLPKVGVMYAGGLEPEEKGGHGITKPTGSWNMVGREFYMPAHKGRSAGGEKWEFLLVDVGFAADNDIDQRRSLFKDHMEGHCGLKIGRGTISHLKESASSENWDKRFADMKSRGARFALVGLPDTDAARYEKVKHWGDVKYGIPTTCVVWSKFDGTKRSYSYLTNVGMKVNLKLGGANHGLAQPAPLIASGTTMFVGYDVIHPTGPPKAKKQAKDGEASAGPSKGDAGESSGGRTGGEPSKKGSGEKAGEGPEEEFSIVGLVASTDRVLAQWPGVAWKREARVEINNTNDVDFRAAFTSRLDTWLKLNKHLPENIVIYRDGVSESQYRTILQFELPNIQKACEVAYAQMHKPIPRVAIIVAVKRHNTRFYPTSTEQSDYDSTYRTGGNVLPGTVVDRGVTSTNRWDFFLTSHKSLQGTARPTHYVVVHDEVFRRRHPGRPEEAVRELEELTNQLCYTYGRSTTAVGYCTPAYLADRLCGRARVYADHPGGGAGGSGHPGTWPARAVNVHGDLRDKMFYM